MEELKTYEVCVSAGYSVLASSPEEAAELFYQDQATLVEQTITDIFED